MSLNSLTQKYLRSSSVVRPEERDRDIPSELPTDVADWPEVWRRKLRFNAETLEVAIDLKPAEAVEAAENGTRVEYHRRHGGQGRYGTSPDFVNCESCSDIDSESLPVSTGKTDSCIVCRSSLFRQE